MCNTIKRGINIIIIIIIINIIVIIIVKRAWPGNTPAIPRKRGQQGTSTAVKGT